jgi:uncharacterized protein (DUF488 family)
MVRRAAPFPAEPNRTYDAKPRPVKTLATIGYELATPKTFLTALEEAGVEIVVDVRAIASSRRPGFAKTRLASSLEDAGIEYLHLRGLGTPAEGRAAARAGKHGEMLEIYHRHLQTPVARADLEALIEIVRSGKRACLLCLEAEATHCHRSAVAAAVAERMPVTIEHLTPGD